VSYDITLYRREFLKRAIENNLGDWTGADPIPDAVMKLVIGSFQAAGFVSQPVDESFADFLRQEGVVPGEEFVLDTSTVLARMTVFPGQIAFSIPHGERSNTSVDFCVQLASQAAEQHSLGFYDPQEGEAVYG